MSPWWPSRRSSAAHCDARVSGSADAVGVDPGWAAVKLIGGEPLLEGQTAPRPGPGRQQGAASRRTPGSTGQSDLHHMSVLPPRPQQQAGQIAELVHLRPRELGSHALGRPAGERDQLGGHLPGGHRLYPHARHQGQRPARTHQELSGELVELGCPQHAARHRTGENQGLLAALARVVAEVHPVDAHDRQGDMLAYARPMARREQPPGTGGEEAH